MWVIKQTTTCDMTRYISMGYIKMKNGSWFKLINKFDDLNSAYTEYQNYRDTYFGDGTFTTYMIEFTN